MWIDYPTADHIPQLRELWKIAFGDGDAFLDLFFQHAFAYDRCRCVLEDDRIAAVLYWFDCSLEDKKIAYIYAVATHPDFRNRGLCRKLMEDTHQALSDRDYACAVLVPQKESLRTMYAGMGYRDCGGLNRFDCTAQNRQLSVRTIGMDEFAVLRRTFLPAGGVVQEGENLPFLASQMQFYAGPGFLLTAYAEEDLLHGVELLGSIDTAPGILAALGFSSGDFRTPGTQMPFAMFHPLEEACPVPGYFGFAFD